MSRFGPLPDPAELLDHDQAEHAFATMLDGGGTDEQVADFLIALSNRGETMVEIAAAAQAMRDRLIAIDPDYRSWALFSRGQAYSEMKRHAESAMAYRQAAASYQQNGKPQYQELSLNNALAAEQAAAAPRGLLSRLFRRN